MLTGCPDWSQPESDRHLPSVAVGMAAVCRFIEKKAASFVVHHGTLRDWHLQMFKSVVPLTYYAGNFRCDNVARPCLGRPVQVGVHPGSPYQIVDSEMSSYSSSLHSFIQQTDTHFSAEPSFAKRVNATMQLAAWGVGRFVQIHPFLNGNGRVSRLLGNYFFVRYGFEFMPFQNIARPGGDYVAAMDSCMSGNFDPLFRYFLLLLATN
jgi:fido (protein-threonine AMPylation protein)